MPAGQRFPQNKLAFDRSQIPFEITKLLPNGFTGHFCSMFAASGVFQIIFSGALAIGAGLLAIRRVMQAVQKLFCVFPGLVEQGNILRVPDMRRGAGSVHDHGTSVAASPRTFVPIVIIFGLCRLCLTCFCVLHDHLVDLPQDFRCQPLTEVYHQRGIKGQFAIVVAGYPQKYCRYGVSWICSAVSSSEYPYSAWMMQAPSARRSGFATFPLRLVNSAAYRFSISGHGIVWAFPTQRFSSFKYIPTGCLKSSRLI